MMMSQVCCYLVDGLITGVLQAQVDHSVLQRSAHVELQRQIINPLRTNMQTLSAPSYKHLRLSQVYVLMNELHQVDRIDLTDPEAEGDPVQPDWIRDISRKFPV